MDNLDPKSLFYQMKVPKPASLSFNPCENTHFPHQSSENCQPHPPAETLYSLRELLPKMSPTVLTNIEMHPEDQESEEWIDHINSWTQKIHYLERKIMTIQKDQWPRSSTETNQYGPSSSTINPTTSDFQIPNLDHQINGNLHQLNPIGNAISQITSKILAALIHRSIIRLALVYPTTVNKQTVFPVTVNQLKLRPTQPDYHEQIPKVISQNIWSK